jgi:hypothetical protein
MPVGFFGHYVAHPGIVNQPFGIHLALEKGKQMDND